MRECFCVALKVLHPCFLVFQTGTLQPPSQMAESQVGLYCDAGHWAVQVGETIQRFLFWSYYISQGGLSVCYHHTSIINRSLVQEKLLLGKRCRWLHFSDVLD